MVKARILQHEGYGEVMKGLDINEVGILKGIDWIVKARILQHEGDGGVIRGFAINEVGILKEIECIVKI